MVKRDKSLVNSGDLLVWGYASLEDHHFRLENVFSNIVQWFTHSEFGHLGIAWRTDTGLYTIEARVPEIKITPILSNYSFYRIDMKVEWSNECLNWLLTKVGNKYSIMDAIRAYFGVSTKHDNKWQCAELANEFYKTLGIDLGEVNTPKAVVNEALRVRCPTLQLITDRVQCEC